MKTNYLLLVSALSIFVIKGALAVTFTVTSATDDLRQPHPGSLRSQIGLAEQTAALDTIVFDARLAGSTITLQANILFTNPLIIRGLGADLLTIDGASSYRAFDFEDNRQVVQHVEIHGIRFQNCMANIANERYATGGAIRINFVSTAVIKGCDFYNNGAESGGAIYYQGTGIRLDSCRFYNNYLDSFYGYSGGAIYLSTESGYSEINACHFEDNSASLSYGGGVGAAAFIAQRSLTTVIKNSSFINNFGAEHGGAVYFTNDTTETLVVINSTFGRNSAEARYTQGLFTMVGYGSAIYADGNLELYHNTFNSNYAYDEAAVYMTNARARMQNNVFFDNSTFTRTGKDFISNVPFESYGGNIIQDTTGWGNNYRGQGDIVAPQILGLFYELKSAGITYYYPPRENTIISNGATASVNNIVTDQIGQVRGRPADIGAVEIGLPPVSTCPNPLFVTTTEDNDTLCGSLRYAVNYANQDKKPDVIRFSEKLQGQTFELYREIMIKQPLSIIGFKNNHIIVDGFQEIQLFNISSDDTSAKYHFEGITFRGGGAQYGGAIYQSSGHLILRSCNFEENYSGTGAVYFVGESFDIDSCRFTENYFYQTGPTYGGGSLNMTTGLKSKSSINHCQFQYNSSGELYAYGGAAVFRLQDASQLVIKNSAFLDNFVYASGGALFIISNPNKGVFFENCTFSENSAGYGSGGALYVPNGLVDFKHCTFVGNSAWTSGGAVSLGDGEGFSNVYTQNSVWLNNYSENNRDIKVYGTVFPQGGNYIQDTANVFKPNSLFLISELFGRDDEVLFYPLTDTGSFTSYYFPLEGSILVNKGVINESIVTDQRGKARVQRDFVDIGAIETPFYSNIAPRAYAGPDDTIYSSNYILQAFDEPQAQQGLWTLEGVFEGAFAGILERDTSVKFSNSNLANSRVSGLKPSRNYVFIWTIIGSQQEYLSDTVVITVLNTAPDIRSSVIRFALVSDTVSIDLKSFVQPYRAIDSVWVRGPFASLSEDDLAIDVDLENFKLRLEVLNDSIREFRDSVLLGVCNGFGDCDSAYFSILREGVPVTSNLNLTDMYVYNFVSPNGDCLNDFFVFDMIDRVGEKLSFINSSSLCRPSQGEVYNDLFAQIKSIKLVVFNRWYDTVFETDSYFNPISNVWSAEGYPAGTYFYRIEVALQNGKLEKSGFLELR